MIALKTGFEASIRERNEETISRQEKSPEKSALCMLEMVASRLSNASGLKQETSANKRRGNACVSFMARGEKLQRAACSKAASLDSYFKCVIGCMLDSNHEPRYLECQQTFFRTAI